MSLTGFLKLSDVNAEFRRRFPLPKPTVSMLKKLPRIHQSDPALVGTASDWMIRIILFRHHRGCASQQWLGKEITETISRHCPEKLSHSRAINREFTDGLSEYLREGVVTRSFAAAAIGMATLERVYRGSDPEGLGIGQFTDPDIDDTWSLGRAFQPKAFDFVEQYHLNPDFWEASAAIGGADADLVVRSRTGVWGLVDFKSTRYPGPKEEDYHQLIGYAILNEWAGRFPPLRGGCTYFTRTNSFEKYDLEALFRQPDYADFMEWFRRRLCVSPRGYYISDNRLRDPGVASPG